MLVLQNGCSARMPRVYRIGQVAMFFRKRPHTKLISGTVYNSSSRDWLRVLHELQFQFLFDPT
jgi:hypothetical protein